MILHTLQLLTSLQRKGSANQWKKALQPTGGKAPQVPAPFPLLWTSANHTRKGDGLWGPQPVLREAWEPKVTSKMPECALVPFSRVRSP